VIRQPNVVSSPLHGISTLLRNSLLLNILNVLGLHGRLQKGERCRLRRVTGAHGWVVHVLQIRKRRTDTDAMLLWRRLRLGSASGVVCAAAHDHVGGSRLLGDQAGHRWRHYRAPGI
jgi:hypothetical protein